ncbi:MAG: stalk domain-containing protein [Bacillota bacterium]
MFTARRPALRRLAVALLLAGLALAFACALSLPAPPVLAAEGNIGPWTLHGRVTDAATGDPVSDVVIRFYNSTETDLGAVITDAQGNYTKTGLYGLALLVPTKEGWSFETFFRYGVAGDNWELSFTGVSGYTVSGRVSTQTGQGIPDVTIYFLDGNAPVPGDPAAAASKFSPAKTDEAGNYSKSGLSGPVTVIPSKTYWMFVSPYVLVGKASSVVNFVGSEAGWRLPKSVPVPDPLVQPPGAAGSGTAAGTGPAGSPDGGSVSAPERPIAVNLDGVDLVFDQPPTAINGRTMVPVRVIFEALGATINWDQATMTVTAKKGSTTVRLTVGSAKAHVNGVEYTLDQPAVAINGRTLVPARFVSEALGAKIDWDGARRLVLIFSAERRSRVVEAEKALLEGLKETDGPARLVKLDQAIALDPGLATAYYWRASVRAAGGDYAKAAADFDQAISLDPNFVPAYIFRGVLFAFTGRAQEAEADWMKVLKLQPGNAEAKQLLHSLGVPGY